jgi:hypothetical protein
MHIVFVVLILISVYELLTYITLVVKKNSRVNYSYAIANHLP